MRRSIWKNLLTFVLVLALTVCTVSALSRATSAKAETAPARYSQEVREAQAQETPELSAALPEEETSPLLSAGAFLLVLAVPAAAVALALRGRRKARPAPRKRAVLSR